MLAEVLCACLAVVGVSISTGIYLSSSTSTQASVCIELLVLGCTRMVLLRCTDLAMLLVVYLHSVCCSFAGVATVELMENSGSSHNDC